MLRLARRTAGVLRRTHARARNRPADPSQVTPPYILHSEGYTTRQEHQAKEAWARRLAYFFLADFCGVPSGAREEEKEVNVMLQQQVMGDEAMLLTL